VASLRALEKKKCLPSTYKTDQYPSSRAQRGHLGVIPCMPTMRPRSSLSPSPARFAARAPRALRGSNDARAVRRCALPLGQRPARGARREAPRRRGMGGATHQASTTFQVTTGRRRRRPQPREPVLSHPVLPSVVMPPARACRDMARLAPLGSGPPSMCSAAGARASFQDWRRPRMRGSRRSVVRLDDARRVDGLPVGSVATV